MALKNILIFSNSVLRLSLPYCSEFALQNLPKRQSETLFPGKEAFICVKATVTDMEKAKVFFTKEITPENVLKLYEAVGKELTGKIAIKLHSGEKGNQNFLRPEFWKPIIDSVGGTVVECNTAYDGQRNTTEKHKKLISEHGWDKFFDFEKITLYIYFI